MKALITFETLVLVEVPDGFTDDVRELQARLGPSYLTPQSSDQDILERCAVIRGLRGFAYDEALDNTLNSKVSVLVTTQDEPIDFQWTEQD